MGLFTDSTTDRPCLNCEHWAGDIADGAHALCVRGDGRQVQAQPDRGCVFWIRAIGADDELPTGTLNADFSGRRGS